MEADWLAAGSAGLDKPVTDLAPDYSGLPSQYKWNDASGFNSNAAAIVAPARSPIRLAAVERRIGGAAIPKKSSRFDDAYFASLWKDNARMI
ncbi:MAG: hypothetical protein LBD58_04185 [Treponema sp.]|nr:hypothetical protein [Treponema sp.]